MDDSCEGSDDEEDNRRRQYIEYVGREELSNINNSNTISGTTSTTVVSGSVHQQYASVVRQHGHRPSPDPWLSRHQHINKGN